MKMTGAQAIIECLKKEDVQVVFGYPGGSVLTLYDALYMSEFPHVLPRHEQGAIHAADGYARVTGKVGVCMATSGPGATNLITGIATAYMDSVPLVLITGQVAVPFLGRDSFQEADIRGITTPITKHNYLVRDVRDLPKTVKEAFYIARTGRPGPVLIDIPKNIFAEEIDFEYPAEVNLRGYTPICEGDSQTMNAVFDELKFAQKPLFFVGGGLNLSDTSEIMRKIVAYTGVPTVSSLMGLGCVSSDDPHFFGMIGMHGTYAGNMSTTETDLLIGIGVRFDDRVTGRLDQFASNAKIVHFDIDPAEINKNVRANIRVIGDLRWTLEKFYQKLQEKPAQEWKDQFKPWLEKLSGWKKEKPLTYKKDTDEILPQPVIEKICEITEGNAVMVTDVGQNQMWTAQFYGFKHPRSLLTSGGLGTMGYGLPASMGAKVGEPNKKVICICGDGGFMMNCQELMTIADLNLPVKVMILNNQSLGMVAQWQREFYNSHYAHSCMRTKADFVEIAKAMGVPAVRLDKKEEIEAVLKKAIFSEGPFLVDIRIPEEEDVLPMVPTGAGLNQMILGG
ncbi:MULTISPECIES: biosynthetic-type acetolactate synthase large subunit [Dehalobacter]|jgi:acetolactate synthase-1/2/3 large subunit|uniref:Acetolactate synthase n=2 Tax=Dehalobacter restrictus TaxID=55583 RepID=A0A857DJ58_9FIRM|nr:MULTISPECIES: biosynthetic-type acetolactate synthase large subunit [Dehalobacter]AHF10149.1 acetolactate synthase [Dehalobacter restrictus DSM 9455]MCG1025038.1 biosynthetic-type acetolactate synthase large subunit [Dehalobacter sp.]MDJ0305730.1 biosynthetic-type acetolactate synthase large subunit [Dehalobacter sp.]OCZ52602.1 acetolactate synthase, large subunit, biosynthetic type [Dehalobacter sp. TeCB1]QHA00751.1 biosynthetic-type acetolactate synthase large subunit [Dehalobacter restri